VRPAAGAPARVGRAGPGRARVTSGWSTVKKRRTTGLSAIHCGAMRSRSRLRAARRRAASARRAVLAPALAATSGARGAGCGAARTGHTPPRGPARLQRRKTPRCCNAEPTRAAGGRRVCSRASPEPNPDTAPVHQIPLADLVRAAPRIRRGQRVAPQRRVRDEARRDQPIQVLQVPGAAPHLPSAVCQPWVTSFGEGRGPPRELGSNNGHVRARKGGGGGAGGGLGGTGGLPPKGLRGPGAPASARERARARRAPLVLRGRGAELHAERAGQQRAAEEHVAVDDQDVLLRGRGLLEPGGHCVGLEVGGIAARRAPAAVSGGAPDQATSHGLRTVCAAADRELHVSSN